MYFSTRAVCTDKKHNIITAAIIKAIQLRMLSFIVVEMVVEWVGCIRIGVR
jgi:hypothetical protein